MAEEINNDQGRGNYFVVRVRQTSTGVQGNPYPKLLEFDPLFLEMG